MTDRNTDTEKKQQINSEGSKTNRRGYNKCKHQTQSQDLQEAWEIFKRFKCIAEKDPNQYCWIAGTHVI